MEKTGIFIQGFNLSELTAFMNKTNKKFQATLLSQIEELLDDDELFSQIRKLILDSTNNYARSVVKAIFGDMEI